MNSNPSLHPAGRVHPPALMKLWRHFIVKHFLCFALAFTFAACAHASVINVVWYRLGENDSGAGPGLPVASITVDLARSQNLQQFGAPRYTREVSASAVNHVGSSFAVQFNGAGQYLSTGIVSSVVDNFGIEAWVKPDTSAPGVNHIIAYNGNTGANGWGIYQDGSTYRGLFGGVTTIGAAPATVGTWTHLALVRRGGVATFYVDGVANGSTTTSAPLPPSAAIGFAIGSAGQAAAEFFSGAIDEVRVFTFGGFGRIGAFSVNDLLVNLRRVTTQPATDIGPTNATLNGSVNPFGAPASGWFEWGLDTNYGNVTPPQDLGVSTVQFTNALTGLYPGIAFHYRAVTSNDSGTVSGIDQSVQTISPDLAIPGAVTAAIGPPEAVTDGARWSLDGGPAQPTGVPQPWVTPGNHTVGFSALANWREPQPVAVSVMGGRTSQVAAVYTRIPTFDVHEVPEQHARTNETVEFFVTAGTGTPQLQVTATPSPTGAMTFDPATGRFTYTPAPGDRLPFSITFLSNGVQIATTTITPFPNLPSEEITINYDRPLPDDESRDYINITENQNAAEVFNDATQQTLSVDISGKTLVFDVAHPANLHRQYSGRENIKDFRLFAERVIIRSPLLLPQTHVTIHARELRFESGGLIDTMPKARMLLPPGAVWEDDLFYGHNGDAGHAGGDVEVVVERFHADPTPATRFILHGGQGGPAGEGRDGMSELNLPADGDWNKLMARAGIDLSCGLASGASGYKLYYELWLDGVLRTTCGRQVTAYGEPAVPAGIPGSGGSGGTLRSTLNLARYADLSGGSAGATGNNHVGGTLASQFVYEITTSRLFKGVRSITYSDTAAPKAPGASAAAPLGTGGASGTAELISDASAWLHSFGLRSIVDYAKDAYLNGHNSETRSLLAEYRDLIRALQPVVPAGTNLSDAAFAESTSLDQLTLEMDTLLHRIDSNLDFFGNPAGWVPMLSLEANLTAFQREVDQSIPILYLAYWLNHAATNVQDSLVASGAAVEKLKAELGAMAGSYDEAQTVIPRLKVASDAILVRINNMKIRLSMMLSELEARARQNVEDRQKEPFWKKAVGFLDEVAHLIPIEQPALGEIGSVMELATKIDPANPLESVEAVAPKAFETFSAANISACLGADGTANTNAVTNSYGFTMTTNISGTTTNSTNTVKQAKQDKDKGLSECAKFLGDELKGFAAVFKEATVDSKEVKAELDKLKASDSYFLEAVSDLEQLNKDKAAFAKKLAVALQTVATLTSAMTENTLATDHLEDRIGNALAALDHNALLHIKEMERRAKDRLLQFQYFVAKSFQYRLLQPYRGNLELNRLFDRFQALVESGTNSHFLSADEYANLKSLYIGELQDTVGQALTFLEAHPPEHSLPVRVPLSAEELQALNSTNRQVMINLQKRGLFPSFYQNIRISDLRTRSLTAHPVGGSLGSYALAYIDFAHLGISRLTSGSQTFLFRHYQTEAVNPITWDTVYDGVANSVSNSELSPAADSLLRNLLNQPSDENLLLFSRPAADADILISKEVRTDNGIDLVIDSLVVEVQYEYASAPLSQAQLEVVVTDELQPIIAISQPDLNGRRDGQGDFRRIFPAGAVVTLQAPASYGERTFDRWVVNNQPRPAGDTSITLAMTAAVTAEARFGPAPSAGTAPEIVQPPQNATVALASTATFNIGAAGTGPLTILWRKNGAPVTDGGRIAGATTATLTIANIGLTDAAAYSVVVSNLFGTRTSAAAMLTVTAPSLSMVPPAPGNAGTVGFRFPTVAGLRYVIEGKISLNDTAWTPVQVMTGTGGAMQFTHPTSTGSSFFRLRVDSGTP